MPAEDRTDHPFALAEAWGIRHPGTGGAKRVPEVAQKVLAAERDWDLARALLVSYDIRVEPVTEDDAERAARRWRADEGLSLADRLCLALAVRTALPVWTADPAWGAGPGINQIR